MNLVNTLIIVAVVALLIFIVKFLRQIKRVQAGRNIATRGSIVVNWLLLIIFVGSLTGVGISKFADHHQSNSSTVVAKTPQTTSAVKDTGAGEQPLTLKFRNDVTMDSDDAVRLKITVSAGAKVVIEGRNTGTKYTSFTSPGHTGTVTKTIVLETAGPYKVVARRNGKKISKNLIVRDNQTASGTTVTVTSSQRTSSASSSSTTTAISSSSLFSPTNSDSQSSSSNTSISNAQ